MIFGFDTESTYRKDRDIRSLGVKKYVRHPETDHYLAAVYCPDLAVSKFPEDFPWEIFSGSTVLGHNAAYDKAVFTELCRRKIVPNVRPKEWFCTADMVAYMQCARSLESAMACLYKRTIDKGIRAGMKGRTWDSCNEVEQQNLVRYCLHDAELCYKLWVDYQDKWPDFEKRMSQHTMLMTDRGIAVDIDLIEKGVEKTGTLKWEAEQRIPWVGTVDDKGKEAAVSSINEINKMCNKVGIPRPPCTDAKSEEFADWLGDHAEDADFVRAVQEWRQFNRAQTVLKAMHTRQVGGILSYSLKYFGAPHTGRWAGDKGLNMHNFPRKPLKGIDLRACLIPRPGFKFVCADLAQIEARIALWLAKDEQVLAPLRQGADLYEVHARNTMGYTDPRPLAKVDPDLRQFAKARVLALGFGMGPGKFIRVLKQATGKDISDNEARNAVSQYRRSNRGITAIWKQLEDDLKDSRGGEFRTELPSGRIIRYFDITEKEPICGRVEMGAPTKKLYGCKIFENAVQATARDLFARCILRVEHAGYPVVLHVHDEVVCEVPETEAQDCAQDIQDLMEQVPAWARGLPVASEVKVRDCYGK